MVTTSRNAGRKSKGFRFLRKDPEAGYLKFASCSGIRGGTVQR